MVRGSSVEGKLICDNSSGPRPIGLFKNSVFDAGPQGGDNRLEDVDDGTAERCIGYQITPVPAFLDRRTETAACIPSKQVLAAVSCRRFFCFQT